MLYTSKKSHYKCKQVCKWWLNVFSLKSKPWRLNNEKFCWADELVCWWSDDQINWLGILPLRGCARGGGWPWVCRLACPWSSLGQWACRRRSVSSWPLRAVRRTLRGSSLYWVPRQPLRGSASEAESLMGPKTKPIRIFVYKLLWKLTPLNNVVHYPKK